MACHSGNGLITLGDIPADERSKHILSPADSIVPDLEIVVRHAMQQGMQMRDIITMFRETSLRVAVEEECSNLQKAAKRLGISDRSLQLWKADRQQTSQHNCLPREKEAEN